MIATMIREAVVLEKSKLREWVNALIKDYSVSAPVKGYKDVNFKELDETTEFTLDYVRTIIPPKKFLHPTREDLVAYQRNNGTEWKLPEITKKTVVLGIHPCDARALESYDKVFGGEYPDPYYWNRRKNTIFVVMSCQHPDENCFCLTFDENGPTMGDKGYDLLMTDIGDKYFIEIGSLEGSLLVQYPFFSKATDENRKKRHAVTEVARQKVRILQPDGKHLPEFLEQNYNNEEWNSEIEKCVSCGNCSMVCPTCFCYHVEDFNKWNTIDGNRTRMWDSCQLIDFSEVAMGENFRKDRGARMKWRIYHKLAYWPEQFGTYGCTGCGRCISYCIADIDMTRIIAAMRGEKVNA
jgi:ferredoxin